MKAFFSPHRYAWLVVGLLWLVAALNYLDRLIIPSMRGFMLADIPMTEAQFGLVTAVFLWVYGLMSPIGGFLADRYSRKAVIIASMVVWTVMAWFTGQARTFGELLAVRALMGIGEACYLSAALALISDYHTGSTRSLATGLHMSGLYAGAALGGAGGWVAAQHGWRHTFTLLSGFGALYTLVVFLLLRDHAPDAAAQTRQASAPLTAKAACRALFTERSFWILLAYLGCAGIAFWLINGWLPTFLLERFDHCRPALWAAPPRLSRWLASLEVNRGSAGLWATVPVQISSFLGILLGGTLADRWSRHNPRGRILVPVLGFVAAGPGLLVLATTSSFPVAVGALVVFGLGRGFADANLMPIVRQSLDCRYSATAYGILNLMGVGVGGVMIYCGGWLRDQKVGLTPPFIIAGAGLFLAGLALALIRPRSTEAGA